MLALPKPCMTLEGVSLEDSQWHSNTNEDIEAATTACAIEVVIDEVWHRRLVKALKYDDDIRGSRGLALQRDMEGLGLLVGDRLDPSKNLPDVGKFKEISTFPASVFFGD